MKKTDAVRGPERKGLEFDELKILVYPLDPISIPNSFGKSVKEELTN